MSRWRVPLLACLLAWLASPAVVHSEALDAADAAAENAAPAPRRVMVMLNLGAEHYRAGGDYGGSYGDAMGEKARLRLARRIARRSMLFFASSTLCAATRGSSISNALNGFAKLVRKI